METESPAAVPRAVRARWLVAALVLCALILGVGAALGGEASSFALAGATYAPFVLLVGLFQLGNVWRRIRTVAWLWFWVVLLGYGALALTLTYAALQPRGQQELAAGQSSPLLVAAGLIGLCLLLGAALHVSGAWAAIAHLIGARLERGRSEHAAALVGVLVLALVSCVPLIALGGVAPFLSILEHDEDFFSADRSSGGLLADMFYALVWTFPLAIIGAGLPLLRDWRAGLARLGVGPLRWRHLPVLLAVTAGLLAVGFAMDELIARVWDSAGWPRTSTEGVERLFEDASSPLGAVSAGITAGVGEELIARGLLQPRLGWLLPNLAFTATHAFQYGPDGLLAVFVLGMLLAAVRARWNTAASMLVHGLYDFVLFFGSFLDLPDF